jgi:hypothetical protein
MLKGGKPDVQFKDVMIEFFVIYTSMKKLISMEKVDLIGYDENMNDWLMTAIDYDTDCEVTVLEVEKEGKGNNFWGDAYKWLKHDKEIAIWTRFFNAHQLKLVKMTDLK